LTALHGDLIAEWVRAQQKRIIGDGLVVPMLSYHTWKRSVKLATFIAASSLILPTAFGQVALTTAQIVKRVSPSVVVIHGKTDSGEVLGSGFIVSKDGKIVTNLHVIRDMKTASVQLATGELFDSVSVLATDERKDLSILQIAGFDLPALEMGNSNTVSVGERVVIIGSPRGLEGTVTAGILSSVRDSGEGFKLLQTDASINPGNSGGPLVNSQGQALGVVAFKLRSSEGLNFAIPINYVRGLLSTLHEPVTLDQMRKSLGVAPNQRTTGPSLRETLDWLKETIPLDPLGPQKVHKPVKFHGATNCA
jgi:S1-C subfamily serine protease